MAALVEQCSSIIRSFGKSRCRSSRVGKNFSSAFRTYRILGISIAPSSPHLDEKTNLIGDMLQDTIHDIEQTSSTTKLNAKSIEYEPR
jgi:hypothetical protein